MYISSGIVYRYELFGDALTNCQARVQPHVFLKMNEDFGVTHECFTSPLSRICSSYNSIFPDTDRYFGSLGSFFDFMPTEGSFFVNPPFDSDIQMTLDHIIALLHNTDNDKNALRYDRRELYELTNVCGVFHLSFYLFLASWFFYGVQPTYFRHWIIHLFSE